MKMLNRLLNWWDDYIDRRRIHQSAHYWHRQGAVSPYAAAEEERFLRLKLEQFRTFASARYLEDSTLTRDQIKQEWLDQVVKPMARSPFARDGAKALKAAIAVMGDEMFLGAAKRARRAELDGMVAAARLAAPAARQATREDALRIR